MNYNDKPGTPEELVHYGTKGMRWGKRKGSSGGTVSITRQGGKTTSVTKTPGKFPTTEAERQEFIRNFVANQNSQSTSRGRAMARQTGKELGKAAKGFALRASGAALIIGGAMAVRNILGVTRDVRVYDLDSLPPEYELNV